MCGGWPVGDKTLAQGPISHFTGQPLGLLTACLTAWGLLRDTQGFTKETRNECASKASGEEAVGHQLTLKLVVEYDEPKANACFCANAIELVVEQDRPPSRFHVVVTFFVVWRVAF